LDEVAVVGVGAPANIERAVVERPGRLSNCWIGNITVPDGIELSGEHPAVVMVVVVVQDGNRGFDI
jgi:hypothetical protein